MSAAVLAGALLGLGVFSFGRWIRPPRPSLAEALAALDPGGASRPIVSASEVGWGALARAGAPVARRLLRRPSAADLLVLPVIRRDLVILERSQERHAAEKVASAVVGLVVPWLCLAMLVAAGVSIPVTIPLAAGLALAVLAFVVPDGSVRSEADRRRDEFREALSVFLDLVSLSLAASSGVEEALAESARVGRGWPFVQLRRALEVTRYSRETSWAALTRLGQELGVPELEEMASSIGLAEEKGARVRNSLAERANAMRQARLAAAEAHARRASQRMSLPVVLLLVAFIVFLAYPAVERIVGVGS